MRKKLSARAIAVIDAETDPFKRTRHPFPFIWGFYDGERYREFTDTLELVKFLAPQKLIVYAHNGGKFDYQYILTWMEPWSEISLINGRIAKFSIGECEFRDSWNILPEKLARFNIDGHKKKEIEYWKLEEKVREQHMPEIKRYLREDCVVLYKAVEAFTNQYGRSLTLAGAAMKKWQSMTSSEPPKSDKKFYDFLKQFYYGGRVQCFASGVIKEPFNFCDINSAYPYAMLHDHPISVTYKTIVPRKNDPIIPQSMYCIRGISRGAFPFKGDDALEFPDDGVLRDYYVTGWEYQAALDTNTVDVHKVVSRVDFATNINFRPYILHFYEMKKRAPKGSTEYIFAKLFMNSLYGKFAANPENYCNYGIVPTDCIEGIEKLPDAVIGRNKGPWIFAGTLGPWAVMAGKTDEGNNPTHSQYYNVATAASITGFVRAHMWRKICAIREGKGRMLYCDTDSLVFTYPKEGTLPFTFDKELGNWSSEGNFVYGGIGGKKLYAFKSDEKDDKGKPIWKTASKGVRLGSDEIMAIAEGASLTYLNPIPTFSPFARGGLQPTAKGKKPAGFQARTVRGTAPGMVSYEDAEAATKP